MCDFLGLDKAVLVLRSPFEDVLTAAAWGWKTEPQRWQTPLEPPFRIRLSAGLPQLLTGDERQAFDALASACGIEGGRRAAFPLLGEDGVSAAVILLDAPVFDLEAGSLLSKWEVWRRYLAAALEGNLGPADFTHVPPVTWLGQVKEVMHRIHRQGNRILMAELSLAEAWQNLEAHHFPLLPRPYTAALLNSLDDLTANGGLAFMKDEATAWCLLPLPPRLDEGILLHQISTCLNSVPGLPPPVLKHRLMAGGPAIDQLQASDFLSWKR